MRNPSRCAASSGWHRRRSTSAWGRRVDGWECRQPWPACCVMPAFGGQTRSRTKGYFHWSFRAHDFPGRGPAIARGMMKQAKILIADDEAAITTGLSAILSDAGYDVDVVADGQKALDTLTVDRYGVVLADLKMPTLDGLALLRELQQRQIPTEAIIITGQATVDSAVQAMQQGAYDYIEKPLNAEKLNRLKALIPKALDKYQVRQKNRELASKLEGLTHYGELTGQSEAMRSVYQVIEAVAPSTASVLILGESGTGKELVARALHQKSDRA